MKSRVRQFAGATVVGVSLAAALAMTACARESKSEASATAKLGASLPCEGGTFSRFRLKNTRARSYQRDSFSNRCDLTDQAAGVIWVATGYGHALPDPNQKLVFKDEQGRLFGHTCWTSSGTVNDVTQTEVILFGPEDSKKITVCCAKSCADAKIE